MAILEQAVQHVIHRAEAIGLEKTVFAKGEQILAHQQSNDVLFVILEGQACLERPNDAGQWIEVGALSAGSFMGLISFWTHEPSFSRSYALTDLICLCINRSNFEQLQDEDRVFAKLMQDLFVANLTQRYKNSVEWQMEMTRLRDELESERDVLQKTVGELERTRNQLVHQEKLATMGQLLAGIAHEINNPSSSLLKSVEALSLLLPQLFIEKGLLHSKKAELRLLELGISAPYLNTSEIRKRMSSLEASYPSLKRSMIRRLSAIDSEAFSLLKKNIVRAHKKGDVATLEAQMIFFEIGIHLRSSQVAVDRITRLIKSLKSYGRTENSNLELVDLRDCIHDTAIVMNNLLKDYALRLDCEELPPIYCFPGEINQVLTNLIANACDASELGEEIAVLARKEKDGILIQVEDNGTGIPAGIIDRIFETNFTTKNNSKRFGLGLGLSISRDLVIKNKGRLSVENKSSRGAVFSIRFPTLS